MERTARCKRGNLTVEPDHSLMYYCEDCRRRIGSSYHFGARYAGGDITTPSESKRTGREAKATPDDAATRACPAFGGSLRSNNRGPQQPLSSAITQWVRRV